IDDLHQTIPIEYDEPSQHTEFLLQYDDDALYIGVRAFESDPSDITARILRQGTSLRPDDRVRIVLDPFHDKRNGFIFVVNPNGARREGIYKGTSVDIEWTGIWQAASSINDEGWVSEMRIPFKTLSFRPDSDWGFNVSRRIQSSRQEAAWTSRNQQYGPAVAGTLTGIEGVTQGMGLDIVPSLSVNGSRRYDPRQDDSDLRPSLDAFYKITPGMNGSLTFNTDFSATEVDDRQVNLTRFSLFFPERRAFFLRESDIFEFGGIGDGVADTVRRPDRENGRPYFSRRIGLSADGTPVDLDAGGKVSGRIGRLNLGAQVIRQASFEEVDASTIAVARAALNVLRESRVGFIATGGNPRSNVDNALLGVDYQYTNSRLRGGRRLDANFWYQKTESDGISDDDAAFGMQIDLQNQVGWRGGIAAREVQRNFNPAVGFVSRPGVRQYFGNLGYTHLFQDGFLRTIESGFDAEQAKEISGDLQSERLTFRTVELQNNATDEASIWLQQRTENIKEPFEISDGVVIPVGEYTFDTWRARLATGPDRIVTAALTVEDGEFYDGNKLTVGSEFRWRPSKYFEMGAAYTVDEVDLPQGDFSTQLARVDTAVAFSNELAWINLVQYDNVSDS
ncbi:MAG: carbohydrate binding family 9 domain-containing protein, partial [Pseudomonadota bacterium]